MKAFKIVAACALLSGCVYDNDPPRRLTPDHDRSPVPSATGAVADPSASAAPATGTSPAPMLVEVDADETMNAVGGDGVGVFVEYRRGGHWHVWWTCDTKQTNQSCSFSVSAAAASGNVSNVDAGELAGGSFTSPTKSRVEAKTTTREEVHGLRFDTNPGSVVTVDATMEGASKDGAFLFFVQGGKVNGGFTGKLTNPLQFQGSAP